MSLHKYTKVHYYEIGNKRLKSKPVLSPSSKESGYVHVRSCCYKSIDLIIKNTPVYRDDGLISTSFELPVPFSTRANEGQPRHIIFQKMPFNFYADMKKEGITTTQHRDVDESEYLK